MMALARFCAIIHITIYLKILWLVGNCHILAGYNWNFLSVGRMVD